jgi:TPR repeat protein
MLILMLGLAMFGLLTTGFLAQQSNGGFQDLSAPIDPVAEERIRQARGLQRMGKWQDAADSLQELVAQGHPLAMFHLGKAYGRGWGVPADLDQSRELLLRAAQFDFPYRGETAYEIGRLYQRSVGEDCARYAFEWFQRAIDWNYPKGHVQIAKLYESGLGVEQDISSALYHYEAATAAGFESAALSFARALRVGRNGMPAEPLRAAMLADGAISALKLKASTGSASAAKLLGRLYRDGDFVDRDTGVALHWLRRASDLGDNGGMHDLAHLLIATQPERDSEMDALIWLRRAAALGHGGAMTSLGRFHLREQFGLDRPGAVSWFERGVIARHGGAMEELASLTANGDLVELDLAVALDLAKQGAALGHRGSERLRNELLDRAQSVPSAAVMPLSAENS